MKNRSENASDLPSLHRLVQRAQRHPFFLGYLLAEYKRRSEIDDAQLAGRLGCPVEALPRLYLCRCPAPEEVQFLQHIDRIAQYVPCEVEQLLRLLRESQSLGTLESSTAAAPPSYYFLAARDRPPKP